MNSALIHQSLISKAVDELLDTDPRYFLDFSIIIAVNLPASTEDRLADLLWSGAHQTLRLALV